MTQEKIMTGYPKKVKIKEEIVVDLRPMVKEDLELLVEFFKKVPSEDRQFLKDDVMQRSTIERWVDELDYSSTLPILALHEDKVVGDATLHLQKFGWSRHVGEIRIVVAKAYQDKGLGFVLARELFHHAMELGLEKIMVQTMERQARARAVFAKLGFKKEAVLKDHVKDVAGKRQGLVIMTHDVVDLWREMEDLVKYDSLVWEIQQY